MARHVIRTAFRSGRELEALLELLKRHCAEEEYKMFARAIAAAIGSIQLEVINRALSAYPQLNQEIEASIANYDRYL